MVISGRAGVPMEVMGLMLGEFVDDYTVRVIDVFAMPQSGTVSHSVMLIYNYKIYVSSELRFFFTHFIPLTTTFDL